MTVSFAIEKRIRVRYTCKLYEKEETHQLI